MTPTDALRTRLRKLLHERIPADGSAADTRFSEEDIDELLEDAPTLCEAAAAGWTMKAGMYQAEMDGLEQTQLGQESFRLTSLKDRMEYALAMADRYRLMAASGVGSRILGITVPDVLGEEEDV